MDEEILNELKALNEKLSEDLELRSNELRLQSERFENELELQRLTDEEKASQQIELDLEQAKAEKRAVQIEQFIETFEESIQQNQETEVSQHEEYLTALNALDNAETFTSIDNKLAVLVETTETTEEIEHVKDVSYFTDVSLLVFLLVVIPAVAAYKILGSILDNAMA